MNLITVWNYDSFHFYKYDLAILGNLVLNSFIQKLFIVALFSLNITAVASNGLFFPFSRIFQDHRQSSQLNGKQSHRLRTYRV